MKFMQTEKKQLLIYVIIAYGITYVMGLLMWYSYGKGLNLSAFPNAQMLYPAAGVMMAYLITKKGDKNLPTAFYSLPSHTPNARVTLSAGGQDCRSPCQHTMWR